MYIYIYIHVYIYIIYIYIYISLFTYVYICCLLSTPPARAAAAGERSEALGQISWGY